jgi:hypothetical protein
MVIRNDNTAIALNISDTYNSNVKGYFVRDGYSLANNTQYYISQNYASVLFNTPNSSITTGNTFIIMRPTNEVVWGTTAVYQDIWYTMGRPYETNRETTSLFVINTSGTSDLLLYYFNDLNNPITIPIGTNRILKQYRPFYIKKADGTTGNIPVIQHSDNSVLVTLDGTTPMTTSLQSYCYKNSTGFMQVIENHTDRDIILYDGNTGTNVTLKPIDINNPTNTARFYIMNTKLWIYSATFYNNVNDLQRDDFDTRLMSVIMSTFTSREIINFIDDVAAILPFKLYGTSTADYWTAINYGQTMYNRSDNLIELRYNNNQIATRTLDDVNVNWTTSNMDLYFNCRCLIVRTQLTKVTSTSTTLTANNKYYIPTTLAPVKIANTSGYDITLTYWDLQTAVTTDVVIPDLSEFVFDEVRGLFNGACMFKVDRNCGLVGN